MITRGLRARATSGGRGLRLRASLWVLTRGAIRKPKQKSRGATGERVRGEACSVHPSGYIQGRVARPILEPTPWRCENLLCTEDELGLRSLSETELNYSKCGSGPVVERARDGTPTLEAKQEFLVS